jgi:hypothetical protein
VSALDLHAALSRVTSLQGRIESLETQLATERSKSIPMRVLKDHYLVTVECDHNTKQDRPICACSLVDLGWHPSVGHAVEAWIDHLAASSRKDRT